ncbi:MAG: hypothetical protein IKN38_01970 [Clostridia bacterium]|nr:hypothetical protein [Clostridia bacterium]
MTLIYESPKMKKENTSEQILIYLLEADEQKEFEKASFADKLMSLALHEENDFEEKYTKKRHRYEIKVTDSFIIVTEKETDERGED